MRIFSLFSALFFFLSCTKEREQLTQNCTLVRIVSDKYTIDTVFVKRDILYQECLTGRWLDTFRVQPSNYWFILCYDGYTFKLERRLNVEGDILPEPYRKK